MVNYPVNEFMPSFSSKLMHSQKNIFPLDISATFFNNLSPDVKEFIISEWVEVLPRPPTETNHQVNQRILLVKNA